MKAESWLVFTYYLGKEFKIKEEIDKMDDLYVKELFIPNFDKKTIEMIEEDIKEVKNKKMRLKERHELFENYLFVKLEDREYSKILNMNNIVEYIGIAKEEEMRILKAYLDMNDIIIHDSEKEFNVGDEVVIKQGGLICIKGTVVDANIGNGYAKILPPFFQKIIKVRISQLDYA